MSYCELDAQIAELKAENARLLSRIAELEDALRPFARVARIVPVDDGDEEVQTIVYGTIDLTAGQFRTARAVLGEKTAPTDTVYVPRSILEPFVQVVAGLERYEKMAGRELPNSAPVRTPLEAMPTPGTYISLGEVRALARIANGAGRR